VSAQYLSFQRRWDDQNIDGMTVAIGGRGRGEAGVDYLAEEATRAAMSSKVKGV
jgi:hypothetical protein